MELQTTEFRNRMNEVISKLKQEQKEMEEENKMLQ